MKKISFLLFMFLFIIFQNVFGADVSDWDSEFKNLCSYDSKFCRRVKNSDGTFAKPKKEIVALLKELAPFIQTSAKTLGIDPRAIAGSIMAENSLNVGISDDVQNLLVKIGVADKGEILGKKFTYGLGQLNFQAAREAEDYAATLEKRKPMSDKDLQDAILIPEKSIYLVGAVIRKVQDDYKKQGIDISDKPEILTTLYNLGRSEEKAAETKLSGKLPRPNYFGFFVNKYIGDLSFLKKPDAIPSGAKKIDTSEEVSKISSSKEKPIKISAPSTTEVIGKKIKLVFNKSVPLYSSPPTCTVGQDYGATNLEKKYSSMKSFAVTGIAEREKTFTVIAPSVDCETNAWQLIKLNTGEVGWIKKSDLEKNTSKSLVSDIKCKQKVEMKCLASINDKLKNLSLTDKSNFNGREIFANPFSNSGKASFGKSDWQCVDKNLEDDINKSSYGVYSSTNPPGMGMGMGMGGVYGGPTPPQSKAPRNDLKDLNLMIDKIAEKEKEIEVKYKKPLSDPENPFYSVGFSTLKQRVNLCLNKQKYNLSSCQINKDKFNELLSNFPLSEHLSLDDKEVLQMNFSIITTGVDNLYTKDDIKKMKMYGMYLGLNNGGYYPMQLSDQYQLKDGDDKKWGIDDVKEALRECYNSIGDIQNEITNSSKINSLEKKEMLASVDMLLKQSIQPASDTMTKLLKMESEKQKMSWEKIQPFLIPLSKMCLSLDDLFQLKKDNKKHTDVTSNYKCYFNGLNILENNNELMLKDIVKESILSPQGLMSLSAQFGMAFSQYMPMTLGIVPSTLGMGFSGSPKIETTPSYCPNKTAEQIEEIVKNNPCIQRVYVPDRWLLNRLNELGDKVMFKPFAEDDRYSFDLEKTQCE